MNSKRNVQIRVPEELYVQAKALADNRFMTIAGFCLQALVDAVAARSRLGMDPALKGSYVIDQKISDPEYRDHKRSDLITHTNPPFPPLASTVHRRPAKGYPGGFEAFWAAYPRRVGKGRAYEAWKRRKCEPLVKAILSAIMVQRVNGCQLDIDAIGSKYIPHPATWLNGSRWEDEPQPATEAPSKGQRRTQESIDLVKRFAERDGIDV